ncbi:MAG: class I SAM-dependent methyltransferase [Bacteroidetes bacterium]|nr:class I SAM-dependent methyltransferase [Bacteroidota bacterium]
MITRSIWFGYHFGIHHRCQPATVLVVSTNPSEVVTGVRRIFSVPTAYGLAQRMIGAEKFRKRLVDDVLGVEPAMRILDIGCGPADILNYLPEVDYVGFDHSPNYINAARERFNGRGRFFNLSASEIKFEEFAPRDLVMSIGVIHHLNDDEVIDALTTARNVLGSGGRFVSADPTFAEGQHTVGRFLASCDRGQFVRTPDEIRALVSEIFDKAVVEVRHDMLHVPYSHVLVSAK